MNLKEVNKWLDDEFGCSYTKLEELHDFYFEKYTDLQQENQKLKDRTEKAFEYIERHILVDDNKIIQGYLDPKEIVTILEILKGETNE